MLDVPSPTTSGENIELTCNYELDNEKLYSVKWYDLLRSPLERNAIKAHVFGQNKTLLL